VDEPEPPAPAPAERVTTQRTPEDLWELFASLTDMQATRVIEPFIGQWMEISGPVDSVGNWDGHFAQVTLNRPKDPYHHIFFMFRSEGWVPRLATLATGDRLTIRGEIERIDRISIQLTNCEIVDGS